KGKLDSWKPLYCSVLAKLKRGGIFRLVTELTDELLRPVPDGDYQKWVTWLKSVFQSMGFDITREFEGAPVEYSSRCLDQFRGDSERIRIVTLDLQRPRFYQGL